jgi:hypothetical protein
VVASKGCRETARHEKEGDMKVVHIKPKSANKLAHKKCADQYAGCISAGTPVHDCRSPYCCISESYAGPPTTPEERAAHVAALKEDR